MRKLIIFCDYFGNGGIEKISTYIRENIDKNSFKTEILCTIKNTQIYTENVICMSNKKYKNPIYRFIKTSFNIKKYTKNADIVNINIHSPVGLFYAFLLRNSSSKVVVYAHNSNFDNDILKLKRVIATLFKYLFCSEKYTYIACSKNAAEFCFKRNIKYNIVKGEIDQKKFLYNEEKRNMMKKKYNIDENTIVIGNVGRLSKQKNQQFLVKIFAEFNRINPNSKLFIIGSGKEEKNILKLIDKYKIENNVIMIKNEKNIENMYQMFDFYVSTSKYEGCALTICEALTSSLKCIVSTKISNDYNNNNIIKISLCDSPYYWAKKISKELDYKRTVYNLDENDQYIEQIEKIYLE